MKNVCLPYMACPGRLCKGRVAPVAARRDGAQRLTPAIGRPEAAPEARPDPWTK